MAYIIFILFLLAGGVSTAHADRRCVPFFRNYTAQDYKAHNRNYDIACDNYGNVFVANFEGLVYYDGAAWHKIHTPGISRITCLKKGPKGKIWIGGYNIFGYLTPDKQGRLTITTIVSDKTENSLGEIDMISATKDIEVHTTSNKLYRLVGNKLKCIKTNDDISNHKSDSISCLKLQSGCVMSYSPEGIQFTVKESKWGSYGWLPLSEKDGLACDNIKKISLSTDQCVWGATDNGVFCIEATSPYGRLTERQGIKGEVLCINQIGPTVYIGTIEGLYSVKEKQIESLMPKGITCWQITKRDGDYMLCATTAGAYSITANGLKRLNTYNTLSVCPIPGTNKFYSGEMDGVYFNDGNGLHQLIAKQQKVTQLSLNGDNLIAETIFGEVWNISTTTKNVVCKRSKADPSEPKISLTDCFGIKWHTDFEGRNLSMNSNREYTPMLKLWINPFRRMDIKAIYVSTSGDIWIGGDFGVILLDIRELQIIDKKSIDRPYIRRITAMNDSIIWGGFGPHMESLYNVSDIDLPSNCDHIEVAFANKRHSYVQSNLYRYRLNGGQWSSWTENNIVEFNNPSPGTTLMEIQSQDLFGRTSVISSIKWTIAYPFYMRWYAIVFYIICIVGAVMQVNRWRVQKLQRDRNKLEKQVSERTAELSDALYNLKKTQGKLVRMERTATAGKLTQGLIDRILNPINYINNFSKLTTGLAKDLSDDIEDEKDNMSPDNYDDCVDILDMMNQNLQKIEEHGTNTTRTLRAMEAILNNRIGTRSEHDLVPLVQQVISVAREYNQQTINDYKITLERGTGEATVMASIDQDAISKSLLAIITNSIYAVRKKCNNIKEQESYEPKVIISVKAETDSAGHTACIVVRDNGVGIEDSIKEKIFDPFFTTKTTGEASGVGLYLVREIIQEHNGQITLDSVKDEYCQFMILI